MNMNLSPRRLWINSNAQHAHQFDCTLTGENMESHSRMSKPDLSTCGSFSRPFHEFYTAFSRVFHSLFTLLVSALLLYFLMTIFNFRRNHEDMIFRPPATISDQANVGQARLQVSGHPSNRWHPDKEQATCSFTRTSSDVMLKGINVWQSLHFILLHNHDVDGRSWLFLDKSSHNLMVCLLSFSLVSFC